MERYVWCMLNAHGLILFKFLLLSKTIRAIVHATMEERRTSASAAKQFMDTEMQLTI